MVFNQRRNCLKFHELESYDPQRVKLTNLCLQSTRQTVMCYFGVWKGFVSKLNVYTRDIRTVTFRYLKHLKAFTVYHRVNAVEIDMYMRDLTSQLCNMFQDFQHFGLLLFLIIPESSEDLNLSAFEWMDIKDSISRCS